MSFPLSILALICSVSLAGAQNKPISITNTSGKSVSVYLQKSDDKEVTVKLAKNHKVHTIKLADLDVASKNKIKKWKDAGGGLSTDFEIEFDSGKSSRSRQDYDDDRTLTIKPVVTIENGDNNLESKEAEVTVLTLGRPLSDTSSIKVFQKETHDLPKLDGAGKHIIQCKTYRTVYDKVGYKHGAKYLGYVVIVHEKKNVVASRSVPTTLVEKFGSTLLTLKAGVTYDKNLEEIESDFIDY
ncbi:hypothetical protein [Rubritalea tangerina]|uniref:hypothetical protein n=1 Tax=Rubritalea tangerina TaxID=430798 RepID=UPI0036222AF0